MIKVVMADDHPLVREGLKHILMACPDIQFGAEVDNGNDLITALRAESFDVVLMDMFMPGRNGLNLIKQVKSEFPSLPIVVLSTHKEDIFALRTLKAGASGYLCKDYAASNLVDAIRKVYSGGKFISSAVAELLADELTADAGSSLPHSQLSDREYQIFLMVASGMGSNDIAQKLNLSIKTVSTHKARIKKKMHLENSSEFVRYAMKHSLLTESDA